MPGETASSTGQRAGAVSRPGDFSRIVSRLDQMATLAILVVLTSTAAAVLWASIIPFNAAPDEYMHFPVNRYIAVHGRLPIFDRSPDIPHTRCISDRGPCVSSYANAPPGRAMLGAAMMVVQHELMGTSYETLWRAPRFASALCVAVYVAFLYLTARALLPDRFVQLTALIIGAFIPQVIFLGAYTNDDTLGLAAGAVVLYLTVVILRDGIGLRTSFVTGIALGALALSKTNYWTILVPFTLCIIVRLQQEWRLGEARRFLRYLTLAGVVALTLSGWWFVRGLLLYGDPTGMIVLRRRYAELAPNYFANTLAAHDVTIPGMLRHTPWLRWSFESFWGKFDYLSLHLAPQVYRGIAVAVVASLTGAIVAGIRYLVAHRGIGGIDRWKVPIGFTFGGLIVVVAFLSMWTSLTLDFQAQGRYLFPALVPVALLLAVGIHGWSDNRTYRVLAFSLVTLAMLSLNLYALLFVVIPAYHG